MNEPSTNSLQLLVADTQRSGDCVSRLVMPSEMYACFVQHGWDSVDDKIRKHFKIPKNRYYSVTLPPSPAGRVIIDHTRTRVLESVKLSKSDVS